MLRTIHKVRLSGMFWRFNTHGLECNSNIYSRRVLAGEFQIVNPWLLRDLVELGIWNDDMKNRIIAHQGSIQNSTPCRLLCLAYISN